MIRFLLAMPLTCVLVAAARLAQAQEPKPLTVAGGFTYLREQPPGDAPASTYDSGWAVAVSYALPWGRLAAVADFGANRQTNIIGEEQKVQSYLFGARYAFTRSTRLATYAQGLFGRDTFREPGLTETGFAIQPGAGVDVFAWKGIGARAQVDYRIAQYDEATFTDWRVFIGGVVGIGW